VAAYAEAAGGGRSNIPIKFVLIGGFSGTPISAAGEGEVELDIEMAMAIAPGLSSIVVFEGNPSVANPVGILNTMAASNSVKNLSCSWAWSSLDEPYTNTDAVFLTMAAQGQTFFNASGDSDAFTTGGSSVNGVDNPTAANAPSSTPYITQVGGTTLAMNGTGQSWQSEVVWDWGYQGASEGYVGSSGGISSYYTIPAWQTNVSNLPARGGSTSWRNIPDVAANADNIYEIQGKHATAEDDIGGTSAAAPLWAGFLALVNQQLAAQGHASAGFINPTLYALAAEIAYPFCYHDVTHGSNVWTASTSLFFASTNYDLCTGFGSMNGTNLINALAPPAPVILSPLAHTGGVNLNWHTVAGAAYQVQTSPNLKPATWSNWGSSITTTGTLATVADTVTNAQRFYRVVVRP
jgi:subtilase family serine protease